MQNIADRVSLGLLPSSEGAWGTALAALKLQGGWLHLHHNVTDTEEHEWCQATLAQLQKLAQQQGRRCQVQLLAGLEHLLQAGCMLAKPARCYCMLQLLCKACTVSRQPKPDLSLVLEWQKYGGVHAPHLSI